MTKKQSMEDDFRNIAVIGLAGRFPGASDIDQYWNMLANGTESIKELEDDFLIQNGVSPKVFQNPGYVKAASIIEGIETFDAAFFGLSPREAEVMDPQHRLLLECSWHALEDAAYTSEKDAGLIGIFAGVGIGRYLIRNLLTNPRILESRNSVELLSGNDKSYACTTVAHKLNLTGPAVGIDTACSTSLVSVHMACKSLLNYECDLALAGGSHINIPQTHGYFHEQGSIFSLDGHCRVFDKDASGTVFGNGAGIVVLKRLPEAIDDGDNIHAIVNGSAVNNDGSVKVGFTAPGVKGQSEVIAKALANAELDADKISYVEAHGTGTPLGDPVEVTALNEAFRLSTDRNGFCALGSVKSNIGHLESAAGIAGFIKTVLSLKHKKIPPTLHFSTPNPKIDFKDSPFYVNAELKEWSTDGGTRRAGVSSFGIGGTNAHVILEESPKSDMLPFSRSRQLILLSAKTETALGMMSKNLATYLESRSDINLADVAYTLQIGRSHFKYRRVVVCKDVEQAIQRLTTDVKNMNSGKNNGEIDPTLCFLFPGQGSQQLRMMTEFYEKEPVFRKVLQHCCQLVEPELGLNLLEILYPEKSNEKKAARLLQQTWLTQISLFCVEYALASLWGDWGVKPQAMIGHSLGEYVAACLSGVFSLEEALNLVVLRGKLMWELPTGVMAAVPMNSKKLLPIIELSNRDGFSCSLATVNSPSNCVVSGPESSIEYLLKQLSARNIQAHRLATSHAFHSEMMDPILERFRKHLERIEMRKPQIRFVSNLTGEWITEKQAVDPNYWISHLRQTVQFAKGVGTLSEEPDMVFLEVGPGKILGNLVSANLTGKQPTVLYSCGFQGASAGDQETILDTVGSLWISGITPDWSAFHNREQRYRVSLPSYPFDRKRYWIDPAVAVEKPENEQKTLQTQMEKKEIAQWFYLPDWKQTFSTMDIEEDSIGKKCWLLFIGTDNISKDLVKTLRTKTDQVIVVTLGEIFEQIDDRTYKINPLQDNEYKSLFDSLEEAGLAPDNVVHLWNLASEELINSSPNSLRKNIDPTAYSLLAISRTMVGWTITSPVSLWIVTNHLQSVSGEESLLPDKSMLLGTTKVIPQEFNSIKCSNIDLNLSFDEREQVKIAVSNLMYELARDIDETVVAYRGKNRWIQHFTRLSIEDDKTPKRYLRDRGVYLITGGLGSLGLEFAAYLARTVQAKLVLVNRSSFPKRELWESYLEQEATEKGIREKIEKLIAIEESGATVRIFEANVADADSMKDVVSGVRQDCGPIHGVIHAAGISGENAFRLAHDISPDDFGEQFEAKVKGLKVLDRVLTDESPDFCLLLSSLASILGGIGNTVYSAANTFLDSFSQQMGRQQSSPWVSVNFDFWNLTESDSAHANAIDAKKEGNKVLDTLFSLLGHARIVVSTVDLQSRIEHWINMKEPLQGEGVPLSSSPAAYERPQLETGYAEPVGDLEKKVAEIWRGVFGYKQIGLDDNFFDLGGDSLLGIRIINQLQSSFDHIIHVKALFETPTIRELVGYIEQYYLSPGENERTVKPEITISFKEMKVFRDFFAPPHLEKKPENKNSKPALFLLSAPRSGSTLLRVMLAGHSKLFVPPELTLLGFRNLQERKKASLDDATMFEGVIRALMSLNNCDAREAKQIMYHYEKKNLSIQKFYEMLQNSIGERILVDKTPSYAFHPEIPKRAETYFEKPFYIHLVRHPFGVIKSLEEAKFDLMISKEVRERIPWSRRQFAEMTWLNCNQNVMGFLNSVSAGRHLQVSFEELTAFPEETLQKICSWLNLEFEPSMLNPYDSTVDRMTDGIHPNSRMIGDPKFHTHSKVDASVANQWTDHFENDTLSSLSFEVMEKFGYQVDRKKNAERKTDTVGVEELASEHELLSNIDDLSDDVVDQLLQDLINADA